MWVHGLAALTTLSLCLARRDFRFNELMPKLSCSAQKVIAKEEKEKMERERDEMNIEERERILKETVALLQTSL